MRAFDVVVEQQQQLWCLVACFGVLPEIVSGGQVVVGEQQLWWIVRRGLGCFARPPPRSL